MVSLYIIIGLYLDIMLYESSSSKSAACASRPSTLEHRHLRIFTCHTVCLLNGNGRHVTSFYPLCSLGITHKTIKRHAQTVGEDNSSPGCTCDVGFVAHTRCGGDLFSNFVVHPSSRSSDTYENSTVVHTHSIPDRKSVV